MKRIVAIRDLLFSFQGRISRQMWWVAMLVTTVFMSLVGFLLAFLVLPDMLLFVHLFLFLGMVMSLARDIKRLHDRNRRGGKVTSYYTCLYVFFLLCLGNPRYVEQEPAIPFFLLIWIIFRGVQLAFLPGDKEENDFGPPSESLKVWWDRTGR